MIARGRAVLKPLGYSEPHETELTGGIREKIGPLPLRLLLARFRFSPTVLRSFGAMKAAGPEPRRPVPFREASARLRVAGLIVRVVVSRLAPAGLVLLLLAARSALGLARRVLDLRLLRIAGLLVWCVCHGFSSSSFLPGLSGHEDNP